MPRAESSPPQFPPQSAPPQPAQERTVHNSSLPSPFYALFIGAQNLRLRYPVDSNGDGPWLLPDGSPDSTKHSDFEKDEVEAVDLGGQRYRIASAPPTWLSGFRLRWGDLIRADRDGDLLSLIRLELPREFVHYDLDAVGGRSPGVRASELVHRFGGGWETRLGVSSLAVPTERSGDFEEELTRLGESFERTGPE